MTKRMTADKAMQLTKERYKETLAYLAVTDTSEFEAYHAASGLTYEQARKSYIASRGLTED